LTVNRDGSPVLDLGECVVDELEEGLISAIRREKTGHSRDLCRWETAVTLIIAV